MAGLKISILLEDGLHHGIDLDDLAKEGEKYGSLHLFMSEFEVGPLKETNIIFGAYLCGFVNVKKVGRLAESVRSHWISRYLTLTSDKKSATNVSSYELIFEDDTYYILLFDVEKEQPMVMYAS